MDIRFPALAAVVTAYACACAAATAAPDETAANVANPLARPEVRAWVDETADRLVVPREHIERVAAHARHNPEVVRLILPPPATKPRTWKGYRARFLDPERIAGGVTFWDAHAAALDRAAARWGVPPEIIVAIAGVETVYGRVQGEFTVVDALATLGFDWPAEAPKDRSAFFRDQLAQLIAYAWERDLDPFALKGSYAGAIGIAQFMPGSIRRYAVDFDDDGRVDLRASPADAIGSIANFLAEHGWLRGEPVTSPATTGGAEVGAYLAHDLVARHALGELAEAGIRCQDDEPTPERRYGLVDLDTPNAPTEYRCATANFFAITQYNRSFFYAAAVSDLAAAVRSARTRPQQTPVPRKRMRRHRP